MSTSTSNTLTTSSDQSIPLPYPNLLQQDHRFILNQPNLKHLHQNAFNELIENIKKDEMGPFLKTILEEDSKKIPSNLLSKIPKTLLQEIEQINQSKLKLIEQKIKDSIENLGETEISDSLRSKASYLSQIGANKDDCINSFEIALEKQAGLGSKIDLRLALIRVGFFYFDHSLITQEFIKTKQLVDSGGDWDRRNRLKVYQAMYYMTIRDFKSATPLLLDTISTFTATELLSYEDFITLTIISSGLTLERKDMKKKIIESPEVVSIISERPHLHSLVSSIYNTEYDKFFIELSEVEQLYLIPSRLLSIHTRFYIREMRIKAYNQLLESYKSVSMKSMAKAFGVTEEFIDSELSRFISAGRLNCSIDKVNGIVETKRPDSKNSMYISVVKNGDSLLNSIQKLSRVIG